MTELREPGIHERPAGRDAFVGVVTGATGGVGSPVARTLAAAGGSLVLTGRRTDALHDLARALETDAGRIAAVAADLSRDEGTASVAAAVRRFADRVDVLVHAAGMFERGTVAATKADSLDALYDTNVRARFALTRELMPLLKAARGQVVFVNSSLGLRSGGGVGAYAASMQASGALAEALRDEVNADGVRVLILHLGRTATPMQERIHREEGREYEPERLIQPETVAETIMFALRISRDAEVTDLTLRPMKKPRPK